MKLYAKSLALMISLSLLACDKTDIPDFNNSDNPALDEEQSGSNQDGSTPSVDANDPTSNVFQETEETSNLEDDDKVENSTFTTQINIIFNGYSVSHDTTNVNIEITNTKVHFVINSSSMKIETVFSGKIVHCS